MWRQRPSNLLRACRMARQLRKLWATSSAPSSSASPRQDGGEAPIRGKARVNGVDLHYEMRGSGAHPIVCIPGALGTKESDFGPQLEHFGREGSGFTIVGFDPRGYGQSRPAERFRPGKNLFLADAQDADALMQQHLSFPRYSVFGWSDGGIASLILAATFPGSVRNLVVWGANAFVSKEDVALYEKLRDVGTWSARMRDPLLEIYGDSLQELWSRWMDCIIDFQKQNDGDICTDDLPKIACPTLLVHGAKDPMVPSFHPEFLRDRMKGSRLEVFEEGKHNLHLRFHQEFNKLVESFLQD